MGSALPLIISVIPKMKIKSSGDYKSNTDVTNYLIFDEENESFEKEKLRDKIFKRLYEIMNLTKNYRGKYIKICRVNKHLNFCSDIIKSILFDSDLLFKIMIRKFLSVHSSIYIKFYDKQNYSQKIIEKFYDNYLHSHNEIIMIRDKINIRNEILAETIARNYNIVLKDSGYEFKYKQQIRKVFIIESYTIFHEYCVYTY
ncbi:hypothetical protein QJ854_gp537 [Moumouvirus goulette]|uniref:Uncharacterized protein n=1 Tax=Moumouvirus goulette TaxID=1247379 RepID=M1NMH6_9VIRU|nr:hypothetical protein QJ854_gp537 [Moumouvirus goulette]AGF85245.1 hypothetical protein glt_00436 [Moumouvirus goulette]